VIDEEKGMELAGPALSSDVRITVDLPLKSWWLILSSLQLVVANAYLGSQIKEASEQIGRHIQSLIVEQLPAVEELAEAGWDRDQDYIEYEDDEDDGYGDPYRLEDDPGYFNP